MNWPLWVHPRERGQFDFHLAVFSEPEAPVAGMSYRCSISLLLQPVLVSCVGLWPVLASGLCSLSLFCCRMCLSAAQVYWSVLVSEQACIKSEYRQCSSCF